MSPMPAPGDVSPSFMAEPHRLTAPTGAVAVLRNPSSIVGAVGLAQDHFKEMLRGQIAPAIRAEGLKGSGSEYSLPDPNYLAMLGFQRSTHSNAAELKVTVNLKVVSRSAWADARSEISFLPVSPRVNVRYSGAPEWTTRIGLLMSQPHDHWWTLRAEDDPVPIASEIMVTVRTLAIPALRDQISDLPQSRG